MDDDELTEIDFDEDDEDECGMTEDGFCQLAGTEYCDWECPFR